MTNDKNGSIGLVPGPGSFGGEWPDEGEVVDGLAEENLRILDAVFHEAGVIASEDPSPPTDGELEDEAAVAAFVRRLTAGG